eukprot:scaffold275066_cov31-Tisochrysis_lutea.AAC.2
MHGCGNEDVSRQTACITIAGRPGDAPRGDKKFAGAFASFIHVDVDALAHAHLLPFLELGRRAPALAHRHNHRAGERWERGTRGARAGRERGGEEFCFRSPKPPPAKVKVAFRTPNMEYGKIAMGIWDALDMSYQMCLPIDCWLGHSPLWEPGGIFLAVAGGWWLVAGRPSHRQTAR